MTDSDVIDPITNHVMENIPGGPTDIDPITDQVMGALRGAARYRMSAWAGALEEHRGHATFETRTSAYDRTYGFVCSCSGTEQEWTISLRSLTELAPAVRISVQNLYRHRVGLGRKKIRRDQRRADIKARALLHRYLTKEQRWEFRATKAFTVRGQDERTYLVTHGYGDNVRVLEDNKQTVSLCLVPKEGSLPIFDLLLAQKVLLENDIQHFLRTARARDLRTKLAYPSGAFLLGEHVVPYAPPDNREFVFLPIAAEDLDNPTPWVAARLQAAQEQRNPDAEAEAAQAQGDPNADRRTDPDRDRDRTQG